MSNPGSEQTMQFDPDRTFGEIHSDSKSLHERIEEIIDIALVEAPSDEAPKLRFVTPRDYSRAWYLNDACTDYDLTAPGYQLDYIAVSYCWSYSKSKDSMPVIPRYRLYDALHEGLPSRRIRCPEMVFHRAFAFARKNRIRHVWNDQECINQEDPEDIEKHLKIMAQLYQKSTWTVAILSTVLHTADQLRALSALSAGHSTQLMELFQTPELLDAMTHALKLVTSDKWFTRTWTMHEQSCTHPAHL